MAKDLGIAILMDFYGGMLTDKRYDVLDMYYNQDMSLAEIGDELDISRQGVRDAVKHGERQLTELEEKLGLVKRFSNIKTKIGRINNILEAAVGIEEITDIKRILNEIENEI